MKRFKTRQKAEEFVASLWAISVSPRSPTRSPQSSPMAPPPSLMPPPVGMSTYSIGSQECLNSRVLLQSTAETQNGSELRASPTTQRRSEPFTTPCNGSSLPSPTLTPGGTIASSPTANTVLDCLPTFPSKDAVTRLSKVRRVLGEVQLRHTNLFIGWSKTHMVPLLRKP